MQYLPFLAHFDSDRPLVLPGGGVQLRSNHGCAIFAAPVGPGVALLAGGQGQMLPGRGGGAWWRRGA